MKREKILIIDDEELVRNSFGLALEDLSCEVVYASEGREGVDKAREGVGLIYLDLHMPGTDGVEVLRQIRSFDKDVPIYLITAFYNEFIEPLKAVSEEGLEFELCRKPISRGTIQQLTQSWIAEPD